MAKRLQKEKCLVVNLGFSLFVEKSKVSNMLTCQVCGGRTVGVRAYTVSWCQAELAKLGHCWEKVGLGMWRDVVGWAFSLTKMELGNVIFYKRGSRTGPPKVVPPEVSLKDL